MNNTAVLAGEDLLVNDLEWPVGAPAGLPTDLIVPVPEYLLDDEDDDDLNDYIVEAIFDQVGVRPLDTFSFEPRS